MVNKRGYLQILEAIIAVLLIFGVIVVLNSRQVRFETEIPLSVSQSQRAILDEIVINEIISECVLNHVDDVGEASQGRCLDNQKVINGFTCSTEFGKLITKYIPVVYNSECEVCKQALSCLTTEEAKQIPLQKSVYTSTVFLSGNGTNEKVVRLYFWEK